MTTLQSRLQFMESNASFIESEARMVKHGFIQYPDLVGISRAASPHNDTIRYYSYDGTGTMVDIANGATDYPRVATTRTAHDVAIEWKGLAYGWTDRDIGRAMMTGVPLQEEEVRMAFRIAEETKEDVVLNGDAAKGWDSLINKTGTNAVPIVNSGGEWSTATVDEIIEEINSLLTAIYSETNQVRIADTLLLPVAQMTLLSYKRLPDTGDSILDYIQNHNVYTQVTGSPLMIRSVRQLEGIAPSSEDRAMAYVKDMDVVRFHVPQELQFSEPQRGPGLQWIYYGNMVLGGVEIMEPNGCRYLDGI